VPSVRQQVAKPLVLVRSQQNCSKAGGEMVLDRMHNSGGTVLVLEQNSGISKLRKLSYVFTPNLELRNEIDFQFDNSLECFDAVGWAAGRASGL